MATNMTVGNSAFWQRMRWLVWGGAACLLLLPLVAMQLTSQVKWVLLDFIVMGTMLGLVCGAFELAVRVARSHVYVVAFGVAVGTAFLTAWINLAVGIIGNEDNPANWLFFGVIAIGLVGSMLTNLEPRAMARAMQITAVAQAIVGLIALVTASDQPEGYIVSAIFAATWLLSAQLFGLAARKQERAVP